jgi:hypothetical protein
MPDERRRLEALGRRYAAVGERVSREFARELQRILRESERQLTRLVLAASQGDTSAGVKAQRALVLRDQVRGVLTSAGYDATVSVATQAAAERLVATAIRGRGAAAVLPGAGEQTIEALRRLMAADLLDQGDTAAKAIWRSMSQQVMTTRPTTEIVSNLARTLDRSEGHIRTLFDTQTSIFTRQVEAVATGDLGPDQPYLYVGPSDNDTRPFCAERVGEVFTRRAIDQMDNGQLPNAFLTGGGYNCRHTWIAVESEGLKNKARAA